MGKSLNQSIRDYLEQLAGGAHREQQWLQIDHFDRFKIVQVTPTIIRAGLNLHQTRNFSFFDAIVVASAHATGFSVGWTEDMNAGEVINNARISNPSACVRLS